jgi:hypothetical protein
MCNQARPEASRDPDPIFLMRGELLALGVMASTGPWVISVVSTYNGRLGRTRKLGFESFQASSVNALKVTYSPCMQWQVGYPKSTVLILLMVRGWR